MSRSPRCWRVSATTRSRPVMEPIGQGGTAHGAIAPGAAPTAINVPMLAESLRRAVAGARVPVASADRLGTARLWPFRHPLDFLGGDGGGGIGGGPGISVGAALALTRHRPVAGLDLRRRRLPDGRDGAVDRGALPHPAAADRRQQPLVLQRRSAPGTSRPHARPAGRKPLDRPADLRSGHRPRWLGTCPGRGGFRSGDDAAELQAVFARPSPWCKRAASRSWMCTSRRATHLQ